MSIVGEKLREKPETSTPEKSIEKHVELTKEREVRN